MQSKTLKCKVVGIGAWGAYFANWQELMDLLQTNVLPEQRNKAPKPEVIPANERRRAPLPVRLAAESSWQAASAADVEPNALSCVFVSALGDTDLTDYMCKTLASDLKELSPTKFHNSVHNAAAGYWTISTKTMSAANSVAGFKQSVSLTLLEAMVQCESEGTPIMITFYDAPVSDVLKPLLSNDEAFTFSVIIYPMTSEKPGLELTANVENKGAIEWPALNSDNDYLKSLYRVNPSAKVLCFAELLFAKANEAIELPLSSGSSLSIGLSKGV